MPRRWRASGRCRSNPLVTTGSAGGTSTRLTAGIQASADAAGIPLQSGQAGTMFGFYFLNEPDVTISNYATARKYADTERYARFFHALLDQGVYFAPSQFEAAFMSSAHSEDDITNTINKVAATMTALAE